MVRGAKALGDWGQLRQAQTTPQQVDSWPGNDAHKEPPCRTHAETVPYYQWGLCAQMEANRRMDAIGYYLLDVGVSVIPLQHDSKRPIGSWARYQGRLASWGDEVPRWPAEANIGLVTGAVSRLVVIDCESRDDAEWFYRHRGRSPVIARTPRGFHLYFRHPGNIRIPNAVRVEGRYDVRGDEGYVVAPPSVVAGNRYQFLPGHGLRDPDTLPCFRKEWLPRSTTATGDRSRIKDVESYISHIRAESGSGGHNATWRVVQRIRDSGADEFDAWTILTAWNQTNANPPWSEAEIKHKIKSAYGGKSPRKSAIV